MGSSIDTVIQDGIRYIERLNNRVIEIVKINPAIQSFEMCKRVIESLNMPIFMLNPLVARSLTSCLKYLERLE